MASASKDSHKAQCIMCVLQKSYGIGVVKRHEETPKHAAMVKAQSTQKSFISDNGIPCMSGAGDIVPLSPKRKNEKQKFYMQLTLKTITYLIHLLVTISFIDECFLTLT